MKTPVFKFIGCACIRAMSLGTRGYLNWLRGNKPRQLVALESHCFFIIVVLAFEYLIKTKAL